MKNNYDKLQGAEIYRSKMHELADEYIYTLSENTEEIFKIITKPPAFRGMLKYIYVNLFKPKPGENIYQNTIERNCNLDYGDIETLDNIWDIYTELCYKYMQIPTMLNYSILTGISVDWIYDIEKGNLRGNADGTTSAHSLTVRKWRKECEAGLYDGATTGNPGPMFLLKANYGYSEQPQQIQLIGNNEPTQSREEIAARFARFKDLPEPENPGI